MIITQGQAYAFLPCKSVAGALLFTVVLGPVGLLYASVWGGLFMISVAIFVVTSQFYFVTFLVWMICCVWSVAAVETYNRKIVQKVQENK